jgi:hypothetical protein
MTTKQQHDKARQEQRAWLASIKNPPQIIKQQL